MKFTLAVILAVLFSVVFNVSCVDEESCTPEFAKQCFIKINFHELILIESAAETLKKCGDLTEALKCGQSAFRRCAPEEVIALETLDKITDFISEICTDGSSLNKVYVENGDCLIENQDIAETCIEQTETLARFVSSLVVIEAPGRVPPRAICLAVMLAGSCICSRYTSVCNAEAADFVIDGLKLIQPLLLKDSDTKCTPENQQNIRNDIEKFFLSVERKKRFLPW